MLRIAHRRAIHSQKHNKINPLLFIKSCVYIGVYAVGIPYLSSYLCLKATSLTESTDDYYHPYELTVLQV